MKTKNRKQMFYFGFIALLMLSEMVGSNIYSLLGPLEDTAVFMDVSVAAERVRLVILIVLDAIPGVGALMAIRGYRRVEAAQAGRIGVYVTTYGMIAYGSYQFLSAVFQLGNRQSFVMLVGVVYSLLGVVAWFVGRNLRNGVAWREESIPADSQSAGR